MTTPDPTPRPEAGELATLRERLLAALRDVPSDYPDVVSRSDAVMAIDAALAATKPSPEAALRTALVALHDRAKTRLLDFHSETYCTEETCLVIRALNTLHSDDALHTAAQQARDLIANYMWNEDDSGDESDLERAYDGLRSVLGPPTEDSLGETFAALAPAAAPTEDEG